MPISILLNLMLCCSALLAVYRHARRAPLKILLRYFTVLSNLYCAFASMLIVFSSLIGTPNMFVLAIKYSATVAVTVTMLTVIAFLGPTLGYKLMFTGPDLWLHLACPVMALASYVFFDRTQMPMSFVILGVLPVALYGSMYLKRVLFTKGNKAWKDFYGFNKGGHWKLSLAGMLLGTLAISVCLWAIR